MKKLLSLTGLLAGLIMPVVLMIIFRSASYTETLIVSLASIVVGWVCNIIWASTTELEIVEGGQENTRRIALKFGWICPTALVLCTFIVQLFFR